MIKNLNIQPVFSVPMAEATLENSKALNEELTKLFLEMETKGKQYENETPFVQRNKKLFESKFDLFNINHPAINKLRDFCWASLYQMIGKVNNYDVDTLKQLHLANHTWFHITRKGGYFGIHNHANASWSGVYCVADGDDVEGFADSGKLSFISPNMATTSYIDKSCSNLVSQYGRGNIQLSLKPGQLVIFPSWLLHEVKPYMGESERITVAFNCWFKYTGKV